LKQPVKVIVFHGAGAAPERIEAALRTFGFDVGAIALDELNALSPKTTGVLYLPGGWYRFDDSVNQAIIRFVREGGGCVGTCAGSYLVGGAIGLIPGRVLRPNIRGRVYLEPQQGDHPILRGVVRPCTRHKNRPHGEPFAVTHLGGPFLLPDDKRTIVASYDFEGEIGAIVAAQIGKGRAVALASHPELSLADLPAADVMDRVVHDEANLPQGKASLLMRNAVLWAAGEEVPNS
jgi:glutamine amidotransferase-like uncharacterized protein